MPPFFCCTDLAFDSNTINYNHATKFNHITLRDVLTYPHTARHDETVFLCACQSFSLNLQHDLPNVDGLDAATDAPSPGDC